MRTKAELFINNVPEYALKHPLWVVTLDEFKRDEAWFYGAWDTDEELSDILLAFVNQDNNKIIVHNPSAE